jgi:FemAB-related protein (PEP-CTERM system-associated)
MFGNHMISQAFANYGGALTKSPVVLDALYNRAVELAIEHKCSSIEFRNTEPLPYDLLLREEKVCMHLPLVSDPEEVWESFRPEIRNRIRKAEKSNIVAKAGGIELLPDFFRVWTVRMRQLGTPCYPQRLFESILRTFAQNCRIFLVRLDGVTIGAGLFYCFNGLAQCRWAATLVEYNRLSPNNLLYWSAIKEYCLTGADCFDFGRSTVDSPAYEFKKRCGAKSAKLYYQYWVQPGYKQSFISPDNPKYKRKVEMWKKLPLWMTRLAGPYISRSLP